MLRIWGPGRFRLVNPTTLEVDGALRAHDVRGLVWFEFVDDGCHNCYVLDAPVVDVRVAGGAQLTMAADAVPRHRLTVRASAKSSVVLPPAPVVPELCIRAGAGATVHGGSCSTLCMHTSAPSACIGPVRAACGARHVGCGTAAVEAPQTARIDGRVLVRTPVASARIYAGPCSFCMEAPATMVYQPCGHAVWCAACARTTPPMACPICRTVPTGCFHVATTPPIAINVQS